MLSKGIFAALGISLLVAWGLDYVIGIKTWPAKFIALLVSIALTLSAMWYFAEYGENPQDSIACYLFDEHTACREKAEKRSHVQPQAEKPKIPPTQKTIPTPLGPAYPSEGAAKLEPISFNGWWPIGTPFPPGAAAESPNALWEWSRGFAGACQPFRRFVELYPNDARTDLAHTKLFNASFKSKRIRRVISERLVSTVDGMSLPRLQGEVAVCEDLYRTKYDATGSCLGTATGLRILHGPTKLRSSQAITIPGSCKCNEQWMSSDMKCSVRVEKICIIETNYLYELERCP